MFYFCKKQSFPMYQTRTKYLPASLRILLTIAQRFWFVWCCTAFLLIGVVALCFYLLIFNLLQKEKAIKYTHQVTHYWGKLLLACMLVKLTDEGKENIPKDLGACIIVSNHLSMCDIPICMTACPIPFSFLAKKEVDKVPVVGYLARNMHVYIDRKNKKSRQDTTERMKAHLADNSSILIYAEGTRNRTDFLLKRFYDGAFHLAIETQKPLVVMTICGSDRISTPKNPYKASPAWVHTVWDEPICTKGMTLDNLKELKDLVRNKMLYNLENFKAKYPT